MLAKYSFIMRTYKPQVASISSCYNKNDHNNNAYEKLLLETARDRIALRNPSLTQ